MKEKYFYGLLILIILFGGILLALLILFSLQPVAVACADEIEGESNRCHYPTPTPTATATQTAVPPTETPTATQTATAVPPTATVTPTNTETAVPPTVTIAPTPKIEEEYTIFLPMISFQLWEGCEYPKDIGAAWMYTNLMPLLMRNWFCIDKGFYHSGSYTIGATEKGGVPIIKHQMANDVEALEALEAANYGGDIIMSNEPDRPDQDDMTPCEAATYLYEKSAIVSDARIIYWNGQDPRHLRDMLTCYESQYNDLPDGILGIHIYHLPDNSLTNRVNEYCGILSEFGIDNCEMILTEIGVCNARGDAAALTVRYLDEMAISPYVEKAFWFTHAPDHEWETKCDTRLWYEEDGIFYVTEVGGAFYSYMHNGWIFSPTPDFVVID